MTGTEAFFPESGQSYLLEQLETPEQKREIHVQPFSYEDLRPHTALFTQIQEAIKHCQECRFRYKGKPRQVQPYKLIHKAGVWYLAAVDDGQLKNFSVALIDTLSVDEDRHFIPLRTHLDYIQSLQPLVDALKAEMLGRAILHADENARANAQARCGQDTAGVSVGLHAQVLRPPARGGLLLRA